MTRRLSFRVIEGGRDLHRIPVVPRDDASTQRGVVIGLALSAPCWCFVAALVAALYGGWL
jgi:hypothetical protein